MSWSFHDRTRGPPRFSRLQRRTRICKVGRTRFEPTARSTTMATFEELKAKYAPALREIEKQGVRLANLHVQDNKLFIKGAAPSDAAKNTVWTTIKSVDPGYADLL